MENSSKFPGAAIRHFVAAGLALSAGWRLLPLADDNKRERESDLPDSVFHNGVKRAAQCSCPVAYGLAPEIQDPDNSCQFGCAHRRPLVDGQRLVRTDSLTNSFSPTRPRYNIANQRLRLVPRWAAIRIAPH